MSAPSFSPCKSTRIANGAQETLIEKQERERKSKHNIIWLRGFVSGVKDNVLQLVVNKMEGALHVQKRKQGNWEFS